LASERRVPEQEDFVRWEILDGASTRAAKPQKNASKG
jgi:hypothetical protein